MNKLRFVLILLTAVSLAATSFAGSKRYTDYGTKFFTIEDSTAVITKEFDGHTDTIANCRIEKWNDNFYRLYSRDVAFDFFKDSTIVYSERMDKDISDVVLRFPNLDREIELSVTVFTKILDPIYFDEWGGTIYKMRLGEENNICHIQIQKDIEAIWFRFSPVLLSESYFTGDYYGMVEFPANQLLLQAIYTGHKNIDITLPNVSNEGLFDKWSLWGDFVYISEH